MLSSPKVFYIFKKDPICHPHSTKSSKPLSTSPVKQIWSINQDEEPNPYMVFSKSPTDTKNMLKALQAYKTIYDNYPHSLESLYDCMTHFYAKKIKIKAAKRDLGIASVYYEDIQNWAYARNMNLCIISDVKQEGSRFTFPIELLKADNAALITPEYDDDIW